MTREKAINTIHELMKACVPNSNYYIVGEMAIKALEQEPFINKPCVSSGVCEHDKQKVLDKLRAEIMQLDYDIESVDYDYNDMAQTELVHTICREEVLRIIDKAQGRK